MTIVIGRDSENLGKYMSKHKNVLSECPTLTEEKEKTVSCFLASIPKRQN